MLPAGFELTTSQGKRPETCVLDRTATGSTLIWIKDSYYTGADKSLARTDRKKIERSPFFVRRGGHWCRGDLVGRTTF
jgi:hypothetical protein